MSEPFREHCMILAVNKNPTTSFSPEGNEMIRKTNRTQEDVDEHQHEWKNCLQFVLMAYRSSVHAITNNSLSYKALGMVFKLSNDCSVETRRTEFSPTLSTFIFKTY